MEDGVRSILRYQYPSGTSTLGRVSCTLSQIVTSLDGAEDTIHASKGPYAPEPVFDTESDAVGPVDAIPLEPGPDFLVNARQLVGTVLFPQRLVPLPIVDLPELVLGVEGLGVQPLHTLEGPQLGLDAAVDRDLSHAGRGGTPDPDVQQHVVVGPRGGREVGVHADGLVGPQRAEPARVDVRELRVEPAGKGRDVLVREGHVLDDEALHESRAVERVVHYPRVHVVVEAPPEETRERGEEVRECESARPEGAAVVAEEVVLQGDEVAVDDRDRICVCVEFRGRGRGRSRVVQDLLGVKVEPLIPRSGECDYRETVAGVGSGVFVGELSSHDDTFVRSKHDPVQKVHLVCFRHPSNHLLCMFDAGDGDVGQFDVLLCWDEGNLKECSHAQGTKRSGKS